MASACLGSSYEGNKGVEPFRPESCAESRGLTVESTEGAGQRQGVKYSGHLQTPHPVESCWWQRVQLHVRTEVPMSVADILEEIERVEDDDAHHDFGGPQSNT